MIDSRMKIQSFRKHQKLNKIVNFPVVPALTLIKPIMFLRCMGSPSSTAGLSAEAAAAELAEIREQIVAEGGTQDVFSRHASDRFPLRLRAFGGTGTALLLAKAEHATGSTGLRSGNPPLCLRVG